MNASLNNSLFLRQSYLDAWDEYCNSLRKHNYTKWDYIILTASNESQAVIYRKQIERRISGGYLPEQVHYAVLPDPEGVRIGSGGATLNVLKYINEQLSGTGFEDKRILLLHSGGDSKRIPQYSVCGKLFSPVPRLLPDGRRSTLFDELIISMTYIPQRMKDGMLVLSGDALLVFNPLQIDFSFGGVASVTIKEDVVIGQNHGVYKGDGAGYVYEFLHKRSVTELASAGAINEFGKVDIDTGAVFFCSKVLNSIFSLILDTNRVSGKKCATFINGTVRLSFYGDFMFPFAKASTIDQYLSEPTEGILCDELIACRRQIWEALRPFQARLINLSPAIFIHMGTTRELREFMTSGNEKLKFLDWQTRILFNDDAEQGFSCNNSIVEPGAKVGEGCYIEDSRVMENCDIGESCVISNVILDGVSVPGNTVLHGLKINGGGYVVRLYSVHDNPKATLLNDGSYLSQPMRLLAEKVGENYLWDGDDHDLWNARLFPVCASMQEAVYASFAIYKFFEGDEAALKKWKSSRRESLNSSFNTCDSEYAIKFAEGLLSDIMARNFVGCIKARKPITEAVKMFDHTAIPREQIEALAKNEPFSEQMRIYYYLSKLSHNNSIDDRISENFENSCFTVLKQAVMDDTLALIKYNTNFHAVMESHKVMLPLRVNLGGGWSDTPPYCYENGGTVINAAITVNGMFPVQSAIKRLDELHIIFESTDTGAYGVIISIEELRDHSDPFDPFAIHKAALLSCGVIPMYGSEALETILKRLGGGIYLSTKVLNIPKGSGLGTSSILAGACVKVILEFFGQKTEEGEIYTRVLCAEQIMSTGGGWQDQIGGMSPGIKLITTDPGINQQFKIEPVILSTAAQKELSVRFVLINSGQRRLARNLLREIMGSYIGSVPEVVNALYKIQRIAVLMKFELEKGNIDGFADLFNEHWMYSKQLDTNSTNVCIEQIFKSCEDLIAGRMICGAGGGGFLQVILKKGVTMVDLNNALKHTFGDSGVAVWDCAFEGLHEHNES